MCSVEVNKGPYRKEISIYSQLTEGDYETDDYILIDTNGEIQAVSGKSNFWDDGTVPLKDYIALKVIRFIHPQAAYYNCPMEHEKEGHS